MSGLINVTSSPTDLEIYGMYLANTTDLCVFQLPVSASFGDLYIIIGKGSGGWKVQQNDGQYININGSTTTSGTDGGLSSNLNTDGVTLICTDQDTEFSIYAMVGDLNIT